MTIAGEEFFDPQRSRRVIRPNEHHVADPMREQLHAAEDERAHQDFAQLRVGLHERQQPLAAHFDDRARHRRARAGERAATRQHVHFTGELTRPVDGNERFGGVGTDDLDFAFDDHEERDEALALLDEHFTAFDRTHVAMRGDARDLRGGERRKHQIQPRGRVWCCR